MCICVTQWERIRIRSVVKLNTYQNVRCFIKLESIPSLLNTGWSQKHKHNVSFQNRTKANKYISLIQDLNHVTIFWLTYIDDWFEFSGPFKQKMRNPSFFARGLNPKWPQHHFLEIKNWTRAARINDKYTFSTK